MPWLATDQLLVMLIVTAMITYHQTIQMLCVPRLKKNFFDGTLLLQRREEKNPKTDTYKYKHCS